ncbi:MAG TPA: NAD(P)-dependent alcohol dehydrogenase [Alloacidobacterium sp.]|nr:NAD(P)-dependent alcohol dehydrogenase [Alloacidobacterium sp.]
MKAIVYRDYGSADVLRCEEIEKPVPGVDEVLIRVRAASVNPLDWKVMSGGPFIVRMLLGLGKPKIKRPGVDVAGTIEVTGKNVTQFKQGDEVFGTCRGAFAEYGTSKSGTGVKSALVKKPDNVTFEQAASIPVAGLTALQGLRDHGRIQTGQSVLINGAAGGVGTFAVQIAKAFGAKVTGVCSTRNVDMVRSIGADRVIDYTQEDFTTRSEPYDLLLDCIGNRSLSACRRILNPTGRLVLVGAPKDISIAALVASLTAVLVLSPFLRKKMTFFIAKGKPEDLTILGELMTSGKIKAVIDRRYRLSEAAEAFRYLEEGHARGKVIITCEDGGEL